MGASITGVECSKDVRHPLHIGGVTPFSTVDWPGKLSCVAFLAGCPWRCPYCQNRTLWNREAATLTDEDLFLLLEQRRGLLDGVVFSGGEPLAQKSVLQAMAHARAMGFMVGLHTSGAFPKRLREALPYLDWVGMDVKAPWASYDAITRVSGSGALAKESLEALLASGVAMEARTTWHPQLLSADDIAAIGRDLAAAGVQAWAVQAYRHVGTGEELPNQTVYPTDVPHDIPLLFDYYEFRRA